MAVGANGQGTVTVRFGLSSEAAGDNKKAQEHFPWRRATTASASTMGDTARVHLAILEKELKK